MQNFYLHAFRARCKTAVTPSFITAFLLLSAAVLALGLVFNRSDGLVIRAGLLMPERSTPEADSTSVAKRVINRLLGYDRQDCAFVVYTDEEQMKQDIAAHRLECAYRFTSEAEVLGMDGAVIAYRSPLSVTDKVLDLIVAAAYLECFAGTLGEDVLRPYAAALGEEDAVSTIEITTDIQQRADDYLRDGLLMDIVLLEAAGKPTDKEPDNTAEAPYARLFHGLIGLCGWLLALLCAMSLARDTDRTVLERVQSTGRGGGGYLAAGFAVVCVVVAAFIGLTVTTGALLYPGLVSNIGAEISMGSAYAVGLAGLSLLLAVCARADAFPALISFAVIFAALLGGVFFDIREVWAAISFTRFCFPNYYYLNGITQAYGSFSWTEAAMLWAVGIVSGSLGIRIGRSGGKI